MLRQVALLPSGPTTSPLPVLRASSKGRFAVCATLAVYVYNQEHFTHESVITFDDKKLMSISWSADGQKIAGVSQESSIFYADVQTGVSKLVFASKFRVVDITCCPLKPDVIYVLTTAHIMRLDLQRDKKATEGGEDAADDFAYTVEKTQIAAFSNIPTSVAYKVVTGGGLRATVALDDGMARENAASPSRISKCITLPLGRRWSGRAAVARPDSSTSSSASRIVSFASSCTRGRAC